MVTSLVSIIIPTYKRAIMLHRAVASTLEQTYRNIEVLVVSDNEPDDEFTAKARETVESFNDPRVRLITQEKHINGAVARNVAIRQAKGEYIAFLDDDDWWKRDKIEKQVDILSKLDDSWGGISCLITQYDGNGKIIGKTRKYREGYIYKDVIFMTTDVATGTLLLRRTALDDAGYFDERLIRSQDIQLLTQFTYKYKLKLLAKHLHCADCSDSQNRIVDENNFLAVVDAYFKSVSNVVSLLEKREVLCAKCIRYLLLAFILMRQRNYKKSVFYILQGIKSPLAVAKITSIFIRKRKEKIKNKL